VKLRFAVLFYAMNDLRLAVVVLAAGEGTRMKSALPKVLHHIGGRPLLGHVLAIADSLAAAETVIVLAPETLDPIRHIFGEQYRYTTQTERLGTGHALLQARDLLVHAADDVLILFGDTPLFRAETARSLVAVRRDHQALLALLSFRPDIPTGYGRVLRDLAGNVTGLVEERDATPAQRRVGECNSGMMCIQAEWLWEVLPLVPRSPIKGEYYLTDLVAMAVTAGGSGAVMAIEAADRTEALGINDRVQLAQAEAVLRRRTLDTLMRDGITVIDPNTTSVDVGVTVGRDTILLPGTLLCGGTQVGVGCVIGPHTTLIDTTVGDGARVRHVLAEGVRINAGADIEPFTHLVGKRGSAK
jgi:bifunctional UDP-N-acetylglucosamine pyrophosphorylase/glucosamine-1-phosphate N-acetyltransferase